MTCLTCGYWVATVGLQCEACALDGLAAEFRRSAQRIDRSLAAVTGPDVTAVASVGRAGPPPVLLDPDSP